MEWWTRLPAGERVVIRAVVKMLRGARQSQVRDVARAAVKWERGIGCFIKVRLMRDNPRRRCVADSGWLRVEGRRPERE
jgi:hypothetical protein